MMRMRKRILIIATVSLIAISLLFAFGLPAFAQTRAAAMIPGHPLAGIAAGQIIAKSGLAIEKLPDGTTNKVTKGRDYVNAYRNAPKVKWFIIHHEALAYVYEDDPIRQMIKDIKWKVIVLDEAHRFRNPHTFKTSTMMNLNKEGTKYLFLTGTPIVNSTFDLFPLLKIINFVEDEDKFLERYTFGRKTQWGYQVIASRNKEELLRNLAPIYIRRTKTEVLKDLPPKHIQIVKLEMPPDQREVYDHPGTLNINPLSLRCRRLAKLLEMEVDNVAKT